MPIYVYRCTKCNSENELLISYKEMMSKLVLCEKCNCQMERVITSFKFDMLKADRFYRQ